MFTSIRILSAAGTMAACVALTVTGALRAQPASPAELAYERAAKGYGALRTIDAQFEQKISNPLLGRTMTSHGRFVQERPNRVSITFTDPVGDRIVGDGTSLWVYLPSSTPGQVLKLPADAEGAGLADILGQLLEAPRRAFVISGGEPALIEGRNTKRVQLVPRVAGSVPFSRATLWIDEKDARPLRVQLVDGQGVDRTITLQTWTTNAALPKDAFRFTPPKGVKIVRQLPGA